MLLTCPLTCVANLSPHLSPGVLWLCIVAELLYVTLLFMGGILMTVEQCPCFSVMNKLKLNAFAAMFTALSGRTHTQTFLKGNLSEVKS